MPINHEQIELLEQQLSEAIAVACALNDQLELRTTPTSYLGIIMDANDKTGLDVSGWLANNKQVSEAERASLRDTLHSVFKPHELAIIRELLTEG